jgi:hypothetical protein
MTFQVTQPDRGSHILSKKSLSYPLKGRDDAVAVATGALVNLYVEQLPGNKIALSDPSSSANAAHTSSAIRVLPMPDKAEHTGILRSVRSLQA